MTTASPIMLPVANIRDELDELISAWVALQDPTSLVERLTEVGVVAGPINTVEDVVKDPQLIERGMLVDHYDERIGENVLGLGVVPTFSETPGAVRNAGASAPGSRQLLGVGRGSSDSRTTSRQN